MTKKQQAMLDFIKVYIKNNHFPPTMKEIADGIGYSSTNAVCDMLKLLERDKVIKRTPFTARGIVVLK